MNVRKLRMLTKTSYSLHHLGGQDILTSRLLDGKKCRCQRGEVFDGDSRSTSSNICRNDWPYSIP
jgi:hypothetical protein